MHITVMRGPTRRTLPLPDSQARIASGTGQAPTCRAGLDGKPGGHFEGLPTACSALGGEHAPQLRVRRTGHARAKRPRQPLDVILGPDDGLVIGNQAARELMIAIPALVGETFVEPGDQPLAPPASRLRQALRRLPQFLRMRNLFPRGQREQGLKTRIHADRLFPGRHNGLGRRVEQEAQIPARGPFDEPATGEAPWGEVLGVEPDPAEAWHGEA